MAKNGWAQRIVNSIAGEPDMEENKVTDQQLRERAEKLVKELDLWPCDVGTLFREFLAIRDQQKKADIKTVEDYAFALHESEAYDSAMVVAKAAKKVMGSQ
jgi:hypothetical protein